MSLNAFHFNILILPLYIAQSAGGVEYTDCTSTEGVRPHHNECPGYDTKQSDDEVCVMLERWGMQCTPSMPSLPGSLWSEAVAPERPHIYG